jgi:hypothetical protein
VPGFLSSSSSSPGDPPPGDPPPEDGGAAADIPIDPAPRRFLGGSCPWASPSPPGAGAEFHASVLASTCCDARCSCNARCNARSLADCSSSSSSTWSSGLSAGSAFVSWRPLVEIEVPGPNASSSSVGPGDPALASLPILGGMTARVVFRAWTQLMTWAEITAGQDVVPRPSIGRFFGGRAVAWLIRKGRASRG